MTVPLRHRRAELEHVRSALAPVREGATPGVLLIGPAGVGKTAITRAAVSALGGDGEGEIESIAVDCAETTTTHATIVAVHNSLAMSSISVTGESTADAIERTRAVINGQTTPTIVRIERTDLLSEPASLARAIGDLRERTAGVGWVLESRSVATRNELSRRQRKRCYDRELFVGPYEHSELASLLEALLAERAPDRAITAEARARCVQYGARAGGNFDLTRAVMEIALAETQDEVTVEDVVAARQRYESRAVQGRLRGLDTHHRLALRALATLEDEGVRIWQLYDRYRAVCAERDATARSRRSLHNYLDDLERRGLVAAVSNRTGDRGNYHEFSLSVDRRATLAALEGLSGEDREVVSE